MTLHKNKTKTSKKEIPKKKVTKKDVPLLDPIAQDIENKEVLDLWNCVFQMGRGGDFAAAKFILERVVPPPRKGAPIKIELPVIKNLNDIYTAERKIILEMGKGTLSPSEAKSMIDITGAHRETIYKCEILPKIAKIEGQREETVVNDSSLKYIE